MFSFNRNRRMDARAFAPTPEFFDSPQLGFMACGRCRDYFVPISHGGNTRIVGVCCLTCNVSIPTDGMGNLPPGGDAP